MVLRMIFSRLLLAMFALALAGCASISSVHRAQQAATTASQRADRDEAKIKTLETQLTTLQTQVTSELSAVNSRAADTAVALASAQAKATSAQAVSQSALAQANRTQQALNLALVAGPRTQASRNPEADADRVFSQLVAKARTAAAHDYISPAQTAPQPLAQLDAKTYNAAGWHGSMPNWPDDSWFALAFQPAGYIYTHGVEVHLVDGTRNERLIFSPAEFSLPGGVADTLPKTIPVAGVNFFYRFATDTAAKEFLSFLGASYFRALGQGQWWGLSARGVAVDTAVTNTPEEFPAFRTFWIVVPPPRSPTLTVLAELDGPNVTGAYRFLVTPSLSTTVEVTAVLFLRHTVKRLGLAPLTSMFLQGPLSAKKFDLLHPSIHDSDGLQIETGDGQWLWHPLRNPGRLRLIRFPLVSPAGYGLMQRDRNFNDYQFIGRHYQDRPSAWITFAGNLGEGAIDLIEIPSRNADDDNMVAFWEPRTAPPPGQPLTLHYTIEWQGTQQTLPPLGWTAETSVARPSNDRRIFSVYFTGGELAALPQWVELQPDVQVSQNNKVSDVTLVKLPASSRWRLRFTVQGNSDGRIDARITYRGRPLTEDWNWSS